MYLMTVNNTKTLKGEAAGYLTAVLHLAPFKLSGTNVCPMAELAGCVSGCLNTAGRGGIAKGGMVTFDTLQSGERTNVVQVARLRRTMLFLSDQSEFMTQLASDIASLAKRAHRNGLKLAVRLNGTSDIRWEDIPTNSGHPHIFAAFPSVQFYDYTKLPNRRRALAIPNYRLTFSYSHKPEFEHVVSLAQLHYGARVNIAVVFAGALPETFLGRPVIDGDQNDLRFLDRTGVVVGLTAKGAAKRDVSGFVVPR